MGATLSTPEKVVRCCRTGDATSLAALLADLQRNDANFRANRARYLEMRDDHGNTPLTLAAARGHLACVKLLLQYGASVSHMNSKPDGGSALHEAVAHRHEATVEALLAAGANPFVENCRGFTAMDIACSARNVPLLRRLEQCAPFVGWVMVKVPQFGGLGSSWQRRWVVISHRYPNPQAPASRQLTHCVFLSYKTLAHTTPACRMWLDGARAREVYNPKAEARLQYGGGGPRVAQAGITLHRKHEMPSGVYTTGGHTPNSALGSTPQEGYTFYVRPDDGSQPSVNALDRLIRTVNNRGFPPGPPAAGGPSTSAPLQPVPPGPLSAHVAALDPTMATTPGTWGSGDAATAFFGGDPSGASVHLEATATDEQIARRLQEQYDAEVAQQLQQEPGGTGAAVPPRPAAQQAQAQPPSPPPTSGAAATAPDYLTGGGFYPQVHYGPQPGRATAAAGGSHPSTPGGGVPAIESFGRPSAPSLLDLEYHPPPSMPLGGGMGLVSGGSAPAAYPPLAQVAAHGQQQAPQQLPLSESGRRMSAPRLEDDAFFGDVPAAPLSRPASESAATGSGSGNPFSRQSAADDLATCVVCMDAPSSAGCLHHETVHKCLCKDCALMLKEQKVTTCPMCRDTIEAFIMRVF